MQWVVTIIRKNGRINKWLLSPIHSVSANLHCGIAISRSLSKERNLAAALRQIFLGDGSAVSWDCSLYVRLYFLNSRLSQGNEASGSHLQKHLWTDIPLIILAGLSVSQVGLVSHALARIGNPKGLAQLLEPSWADRSHLLSKKSEDVDHGMVILVIGCYNRLSENSCTGTVKNTSESGFKAGRKEILCWWIVW